MLRAERKFVLLERHGAFIFSVVAVAMYPCLKVLWVQRRGQDLTAPASIVFPVGIPAAFFSKPSRASVPDKIALLVKPHGGLRLVLPEEVRIREPALDPR
jgi:hypothetical protein